MLIPEVMIMSNQKQKKKITEVTWPIGPDATLGRANLDPLGMYTGVPDAPYEIPVQDADDL